MSSPCSDGAYCSGAKKLDTNSFFEDEMSRENKRDLTLLSSRKDLGELKLSASGVLCVFMNTNRGFINIFLVAVIGAVITAIIFVSSNYKREFQTANIQKVVSTELTISPELEMANPTVTLPPTNPTGVFMPPSKDEKKTIIAETSIKTVTPIPSSTILFNPPPGGALIQVSPTSVSTPTPWVSYHQQTVPPTPTIVYIPSVTYTSVPTQTPVPRLTFTPTPVPVKKTVYLEKAPIERAYDGGWFGLSAPALVKSIAIEIYEPSGEKVPIEEGMTVGIGRVEFQSNPVFPLCPLDKWGNRNCEDNKIHSNPFKLEFSNPRLFGTVNQIFLPNQGSSGKKLYVKIVEIEFEDAKLGTPLPFEISQLIPTSLGYSVESRNGSLLVEEASDYKTYSLLKLNLNIPSDNLRYSVETVGGACITDSIESCPFDSISIVLRGANVMTWNVNKSYFSKIGVASEKRVPLSSGDTQYIEIKGRVDKTKMDPNEFKGNFWIQINSSRLMIENTGSVIQLAPLPVESRKYSQSDL